MSSLVVLGFLMGIYAFIFGGIRGRVGRPPSGVLTRLTSPTDAPLGVAAMSGFALGSMVTITDPTASGQSGISIGLLLAISLSIPGIQHLTIAACGLVGIILSIWEMIRFLKGDGADDLAIVYRAALMGLIVACFCLAALIFGRMSALRGERGLALFGLIGVVTFLAHPSNRDSLELDNVSHLAFLGIACSVAFALGWAASGYVLGVVAIAVATITFAENSMVGDANAAWVGLVAACAAVAFMISLQTLRGLFRRT